MEGIKTEIPSNGMKVGMGVVFLMLLLSIGVWLRLQFRQSDPESQYARWLASMTAPKPVGRLEQWADPLGIHYFGEARRRSETRTAKSLLEHEDYAIAVASWLDSWPPPLGGTLKTWPYVERSLVELLRKPDDTALTAALARTDRAGFTEWEHTLVRSAHLSGAMADLATLQEDVRKFEKTQGTGPLLSDSLQRISELYAMSPVDLGRALFRAKDLAAEFRVTSVMDYRGITPRQAGDALFAEWKTGKWQEDDWELVRPIARTSQMGTFRMEFLTWFFLSPESESWRAKHRVEIGVILDDLRRTNPAFARQFASHLVREMIQSSDSRGPDWERTADSLLSTLEPEPDLRLWIEEEAGPDFIWLCHLTKTEDLLNRAVKVWNDGLRNRSKWIGEFIAAGHDRAACLLIEEAKEEVVYIRSQMDSPSEARTQSFDEVLTLAERLTAHAGSAQLRGFIQLELWVTALQNMSRKGEQRLARIEVLKAIEVLNEAESPHRNLLELTVSRLITLDDDLFETARPTYDRWRRGVTPGEIVDRLIGEAWWGDPRERVIWRTYLRHHLSPDELRVVADHLATVIRDSPTDHTPEPVAKRLGDFLGVRAWSLPESGDLELASWVLQKQIDDHQWEESAKWMFARMKEFQSGYPEAEETFVFRTLYRDLLAELNRRPTRDRLRWLGAVLREGGSQTFAWPPSFQPLTDVSPGTMPLDALRTVEEHFSDHPLRRWIARSLLLYGVPSTREWNENREQVLESVQEPWLKAVINEFLEETLDIESFERDMAAASPGARRYFWENPFLPSKGNSLPRHPSGRDLSVTERMAYHLWEAEQSLEIVERGDFHERLDLQWRFHDLINLAEGHHDDPRFQAVIARLRKAPIEVNLPAGFE